MNHCDSLCTCTYFEGKALNRKFTFDEVADKLKTTSGHIEQLVRSKELTVEPDPKTGQELVPFYSIERYFEVKKMPRERKIPNIQK